MTAYGPPQLIFDAVTPPASPGETGTVIDLGAVQDEYFLIVSVSGTGSDAVSISFLGSLDGSIWYYDALFAPPNPSGGRTFIGVPTVPVRYVTATSETLEGSPVMTASVSVAVA